MSEAAAILAAIERLERRLDALPGPTVNVEGAAKLLHTTVGAIYVRRQRGMMPRPISKRPLVWRTADVLAMEDDR